MEINKQAVCITAYTNPKMLGELLNCLHTTFDCFVHIDKKVEGQFSDVKNLYNDVHFFSEFTVNWGGMNI